MADPSDVGNALVAVVAAAAYPGGTAAPSVSGVPVLVYQGWPNPPQLDSDLRAGRVHISVFPLPGDRVTSVLSGDADWQELSNDGTVGVSIRETRRQTRRYQVTIWAATPESRDPVASAVDGALSSVSRLQMPDGSQAQMAYATSTQDDGSQRQGVYRRDLFYDINYATTQTATAYAIKEIDTCIHRVADAHDPSSPDLGPVITVALTATTITTTIK